ncbi:MAG: 4Fe-4S binding protein [Mediterranea sp.]|jgi:ferredoxin|nr:4Fe-4S binding protein [Mediterranea sp.]
MIRKTRQLAAATCFVLMTLLFLDFTGVAHHWFGWLAKTQLVPALLAANAVVILAVIGLTLLFGRLYCSAICPLGILQDAIAFVSRRRKGKASPYRYTKPIAWLRYTVAAVFALALIAGIPAVFVLLDPYSAYGRIAANILAPIYRWGNNLLAGLAERADSYTFYAVDVHLKSLLVLGTAALTLIAIGLLAWRNGRTYCNTICPVGTCLGILSRFSLYRPEFDEQKCTRCGVCARNCKSSCIDAKQTVIDQSRCVACFDCIDRCPAGAMTYRPRKTRRTPANPENNGGLTRSAFLSVASLFALTHTLKAQQLRVDGGLAEIEQKKRPRRQTPLVPPGAQSPKNLSRNCTACQLCISACPNHVLHPSGKLQTLMQPEMTYEAGYCRPECIQCSQVCPAGAIQPVTVPQKTSIAIGQARWIEQNCIVNTDNVQCNTCRRSCPTGAIIQVARDPGDNKSLKIPAVDNELCIGCGACEHLCPARPFSAIYVEGYLKHHNL